MSHEFRIAISNPTEFVGAAATVSAAETIVQQADHATDAAGAIDRLAQAAARLPDASLELLAASARQTQASAAAANGPMLGLLNAPDDLLAKLATGFGLDFHAEIIDSVEEIGHVFAEALRRGIKPDGGGRPNTAAPDAASGEDRSIGSTGLANRPEDTDAGIIGRRLSASHAVLSDQSIDANLGNGPAARSQEDDHRATPQEATGTAARLLTRQDASAGVPTKRQRGRDVDHRAARRPVLSREHVRRRGERETFAIHGYHGGGDPGGGLHTSGLTTGSLDGVGTSTVAGVLASAPTNIPSFPAATSARPSLPSLQPTGYDLLQHLGISTAASALSPISDNLVAKANAGAAAGPDGGAAASASSLAAATQKAAAAGASAQHDAEQAVAAVDKLTGMLSLVAQGFQNVNRKVDIVQSQLQNHL